jgi:hypothetical protein
MTHMFESHPFTIYFLDLVNSEQKTNIQNIFFIQYSHTLQKYQNKKFGKNCLGLQKMKKISTLKETNTTQVQSDFRKNRTKIKIFSETRNKKI